VKINVIVAVSEDGYIGKPDGSLPFRQKGDMLRFKSLTSLRPIILGRTTFDTLPFVLPKRDHFVITSDPRRFDTSCVKKDVEWPQNVFRSGSFLKLEQQLSYYSDKTECDYSEVWVIGGGEIYKQAFYFLDINQVELTLIHTTFPEADGTWARFELPEGWVEQKKQTMPADADNEHPYSFITYRREV